MKIRFALLFCSCFYLLSLSAKAIPLDSIGVEKKNGKLYVLHRVEAKETLFSISRKYKASVSDIKVVNPEAASGLNIGQVIRVPYTSSMPEITPEGGGQGKIHRVEPKETLYSISRKYKLSTDELVEANPILKDGLKVGQEINIPEKAKRKEKNNSELATKEPNEEKKPTKKTEDEDNPKIEPNLEEEEVEASVKKTKSALTPPPVSAYTATNEKGTAELMQNNTENLKYWALHKTAPYGTIIQVRNEENDQKIFVRVVGKFPAGNSDKSIIKLSPKAMERLGAKGDKVAVSLSYFP